MSVRREEFLEFIRKLEILGLWVRDNHLPDPDTIWEELNNPALAISVGLLARIKETIRNTEGNVDLVSVQAKYQPSATVLEDLYYLFVFYEYPELKRAALSYMIPERTQLFDSLIDAIGKMEGGY